MKLSNTLVFSLALSVSVLDLVSANSNHLDCSCDSTSGSCKCYKEGEGDPEYEGNGDLKIGSFKDGSFYLSCDDDSSIATGIDYSISQSGEPGYCICALRCQGKW